MDQQKLETVCKPGQGAEACSYLIFSGGGGGYKGFGCAKREPWLKEIIDDRRASGTMQAMGDNCEGDGVGTEQADRQQGPAYHC